MVKVCTPAGIVPAKVPLPLPRSTKVTPAGSPVALRVATGKPFEVMVMENATPVLTDLDAALVIEGAKFCLLYTSPSPRD